MRYSFYREKSIKKHLISVERVFIIMTQTFEQYLEQHDGSNEFTNRRREQVLADARRSSEAYLEEIDMEVQRNGLHPLKPDSELAIPRGWVYEPKPQPSVGMSRADYVRMFNPNGIM